MVLQTREGKRTAGTKTTSGRIPHARDGRLARITAMRFAFLQDVAKHQEPGPLATEGGIPWRSWPARGPSSAMDSGSLQGQGR